MRLTRNKTSVEAGSTIAANMFNEAIQQCKNQDELAGFAQTLYVYSSKTIHGLDGQEFKTSFLYGCISDSEMIKPIRKQ